MNRTRRTLLRFGICLKCKNLLRLLSAKLDNKSMFQRGQLYFHTLKHLHFHQISNRIKRRLLRPRISNAPPSEARTLPPSQWISKKRSHFADGEFTLLNQTHMLARDWNNPEWD